MRAAGWNRRRAVPANELNPNSIPKDVENSKDVLVRPAEDVLAELVVTAEVFAGDDFNLGATGVISDRPTVGSDRGWYCLD